MRKEERSRQEGKHRLNVSGVLRILGISRSGYSAFKKRYPSGSRAKKERRMEEIRTIHEESHEIYGAPKIAAKMRQGGEKISDRTVGKYMREMGVRACYRKCCTRTTRSENFSSELKNILNKDFRPESPNAAWCTDITYIWTCGDYERATAGMGRSYSSKACPWNNACIESFHSLIKREWINRFQVSDYSHAYRLVFEYYTFYKDQEDYLQDYYNKWIKLKKQLF